MWEVINWYWQWFSIKPHSLKATHFHMGVDIIYISFRGMTGKPCGVVFEVLPGFAGPRGWFSEIIKVFLPSLEIKGSD